MNLYNLVEYFNTSRNTELEVIPFTIQASATYNVAFLRSKKEPHVARLTVEKLHVLFGKGVVQLSVNEYCFEEIAVTDLLAAAVQTNAIAEKHGITHIISPNCRLDRVTQMAELIPFEWANAYMDRMAILSFAKKFKSVLGSHEASITTLNLTEVPK